MPFLALLPLIIVGMIITVTTRANVRRQEEARKRAAELDRQRNDPQQPPVVPQTRQPLTPTVQPPQYTQYRSPVAPQHKPAPNASAVKPKAPAKAEPRIEGTIVAAPMHPDHDLCALPTEDAKAPHAAPALQTGGASLNLTPDNIVRGVVFAEIFGKPKALR